MRGLLALVGVLSVLLLVGGAVVVGTLMVRSRRPVAVAEVVLNEPAGSRIVGAAGLADGGLAVVLQGGGADRVVLVRPAGSVRLAK